MLCWEPFMKFSLAALRSELLRWSPAVSWKRPKLSSSSCMSSFCCCWDFWCQIEALFLDYLPPLLPVCFRGGDLLLGEFDDFLRLIMEVWKTLSSNWLSQLASILLSDCALEKGLKLFRALMQRFWTTMFDGGKIVRGLSSSFCVCLGTVKWSEL